LLAPHLTDDNHRDVISRAAGRTKREVEALVASLAPRPDIASTIRQAPCPRHVVRSTADTAPPNDLPGPLSTPAEPVGLSPVVPEAGDAAIDRAVGPPARDGRPTVAPLSPNRYHVHFTIGAETYEELRVTQDLLRRETVRVRGEVRRRCTERVFLELHHRQPFALGGEATTANIALRCRRHNAYEAETDFGNRLNPRLAG